MIKWENIIFDYDGEYMQDGTERLTEVSVPVEVSSSGTCRYVKPFYLHEMDELTGRIVSVSFSTEPFFTGRVRYFTDEPKYAVPELFSEYANDVAREEEL